MAVREVQRAYRVVLDPTLEQRAALESHAGAARAAYNHALAVIASVTISRHGHRWWASVLAREVLEVPDKPTPTQQAGGPVGVDVGVHHLAALSTGQIVENPRHLRRATRRLERAQQALSRTGWILQDTTGTDVRLIRGSELRRGMRRRPTAGRVKAQARVARLHAQLAERRASTLHALSKQLTRGHTAVALEDLNVAGMTATARGTLEQPGTQVRAKAGLNRAILDVGFGELRRQITYKSHWYGSRLVVTDRWAPTSRSCSACGRVRAKLALTERTYRCPGCGLAIDRDINAAINIAALAEQMHDDASGPGESQNAGRDQPPPTGDSGHRRRKARAAPRAAPVTPSRERLGHPHSRH